MVSLAGGGAGGGRPQQLSDPLAELKALLKQAGVGGNAAGIDYMAEARNAYAPQFGYLDEAARNAQGQAQTAGKQIGGLYGTLAKDIAGQAGGIRQNYNGGVNSVNSAYKDAIGNVGEAFNNTNSNTAAILERLGIQEAGSNTQSKSDEARALLQGIMSANNLGSTNALKEMGSAAQTYNTQQVGATKLAGAEAQTGLQTQLQNFLNQISMQRAQLGTQVNQYGMQMQGDAAKQQADASGDMFDRLFKIKQMEQGMASDAADLQYKYASLSGNQSKLDPLGEVQQLAMQLYGNPVGASNAVREIMNAAQATAGGPTDLGTFVSQISDHLQDVNGAVPGDLAKLQRLAALYLSQQ